MTHEEALRYVQDRRERGYEPEYGLLAVFLWADEREHIAASVLGLKIAEIPRAIWSDSNMAVGYSAIRSEFFAALIRGEVEIMEPQV